MVLKDFKFLIFLFLLPLFCVGSGCQEDVAVEHSAFLSTSSKPQAHIPEGMAIQMTLFRLSVYGKNQFPGFNEKDWGVILAAPKEAPEKVLMRSKGLVEEVCKMLKTEEEGRSIDVSEVVKLLTLSDEYFYSDLKVFYKELLRDLSDSGRKQFEKAMKETVGSAFHKDVDWKDAMISKEKRQAYLVNCQS